MNPEKQPRKAEVPATAWIPSMIGGITGVFPVGFYCFGSWRCSHLYVMEAEGLMICTHLTSVDEDANRGDRPS